MHNAESDALHSFNGAWQGQINQKETNGEL